MNLLDARDKLAAVLAPVGEGDPTVLTTLVDSIEPPSLMIGWGEPWLNFQTPCFSEGLMVVTCVGARLVPGAGITQLEQLVDYTITKIRVDSPNWALDNVTGPREFTVSKTNYLACRVALKVTLDG